MFGERFTLKTKVKANRKQGAATIKNSRTNSGRYQFDLLYRHSNELALDTRRALKKEYVGIKPCFKFLGEHIEKLEQQGMTHSRNVKMALTTRFINHLLSHVHLVERGLYLDAANSARSAIETLAFHWLVCLDEPASILYDGKTSPQPVVIRKRLEDLNVDVSLLREQYGDASGVSHVGNRSDNMQILWEREKQGKLLIGGGQNLEIARSMLSELPKFVIQFVMHDPNYLVEVNGQKISFVEGDE